MTEHLYFECPAADESPTGYGPLDVMGIDIGTHNLAMCRLRFIDNRPIVVWWQMIDLIGLERSIARDACAAIPTALEPFAYCINDCPFFAIEQQPHFNPTMVSVSHALITYFHTVNKHCETYISSAQNKLRPFREAATETYDQRKDSAQSIVGKMLNDTLAAGVLVERTTYFAKWFVQLKKRDDAADAFLHAYYSLLQRKKPMKAKTQTIGSLTIKQLQEQLRDRNLPISGKKSELRERLRTAKAGEKGRTKLTMAELKTELKSMGLDTMGTKQDLARRLYEAQSKPKKKKRAAAKPKSLVKIIV